MSKYYINRCYINNKTSFVMSILGCIASEGNKIDKKEEREKRNKYFECLDKLTLALSTVLKAEEKPYETFFLNTYDYLEACDLAISFNKVQEYAGDMVREINEPIEIHFFGHFGRIDTEYNDFLPDFHDKVKLVFD